MKTFLFVIVLAFFNSQFVFAQLQGQALIDSLLPELQRINEDSNKVELLNVISFRYYSIDPDKGIEYANEALNLAKRIEWKKGESISYNSLGVNSWAKSDYDKAVEYYQNALQIYQDLGDKSGIAKNLGNMGLIYKGQSNYPKALKYYGKALKINEEIGSKLGIANNLLRMGTIYHDQSDYSMALEYYARSLEIYEDLSNKSGIASNLGNMGNVYWKKLDYTRALEYFEKSLTIFEELNDKSGIAITLGNMGIIHMNQSNFAKALEYYEKALVINKELGNKRRIAINLGNIGSLFLSLSQDNINIVSDKISQQISKSKEASLNNAIKYFYNAIEIFEEIGELDNRSVYKKSLADAYKQKGDAFKEAKYLREHIALKDSVFSMKKAKEIGKLEAEREQLEEEYREAEEERLLTEATNNRNYIQYSGMGVFVLLLFITIFIIPKFNIPFSIIDGLVFVTFLLFYELVLVITEPIIDNWTSNIPIYKLGLNLAVALLFLPFYNLEDKIRNRFKLK
jgi:tetratricopeptide (TPR) repeat protein